MFFGKKREEEFQKKLGEISSKLQSTTSELQSQLDYENDNAKEIKSNMISLKEHNENVKRDLSLANAKILGIIDEVKDNATIADSNTKLIERFREITANNDSFDVADITKNAEKIQNSVKNNDRNTNLILEDVRSMEVIGGTLKDISNQTSALSLNAAIIGARIDSGNEGFVQTATEIKELAAESAKAINELNRKIEHIVSLIETITAGNLEMKELSTEGVSTCSQLEKTYRELNKEITPNEWETTPKSPSFKGSIENIEELKVNINDIWTMQDEGVEKLTDLIEKAEAQIELGTQAKEIADEIKVI